MSCIDQSSSLAAWPRPEADSEVGSFLNESPARSPPAATRSLGEGGVGAWDGMGDCELLLLLVEQGKQALLALLTSGELVFF